MTEQAAILRLQNRKNYLVGKIAEAEAEGKNTFWHGQDVDAIDLAIAALRFVIEMAAYEASQQQL
jgi:hypothetical protein